MTGKKKLATTSQLDVARSGQLSKLASKKELGVNAALRMPKIGMSRVNKLLHVVTRNRGIGFYIIAPEKSGSTSLADFLNEHPSLTFGAAKESHTYRRSGSTPISLLRLRDRIIHLGRHSKRGAIMFDATTSNSTNPFAVRVLNESAESSKILFLFRDPVERFVSQYWWDRRHGWTGATSLAEYLGFCLDERVLAAQKEHYSAKVAKPICTDFDMQVTSGNVAALLAGCYVDMVNRYSKFDSLALELADFSDDYDQTVLKISDFLGIDPTHFRGSSFPHSNKAPDSTAGQAEKGWDESIEYLMDYYREHNAGLEELCDRRFSFSR